MSTQPQRPLSGIRVIGVEQYIAGPYCTMLLADSGAEVIKVDLGFQSLRATNPRLVYAMISGFGRLPGYESQYAHRPAFDIVAEAMAGVMDLIGFADRPPTFTLYGLADLYSGMVGAFGILQALFMREHTGQGQLVDVSLLDSMVALNERMVAQYSVTGQEPRRGRPDHVWPRGAFPCSDGYVALNVPDDATWARFVTAMGRTDLIRDPRAVTGTARAANQPFLEPIVQSWMADKTRSEVVEALESQGMPAGPVYSAKDVFDDPHFKARGMLPLVDDPQVGPYRFARTPPHLSAAPEIPLAPAPELGAHTREILEGLLAYGPSRVDALGDAGIIGL